MKWSGIKKSDAEEMMNSWREIPQADCSGIDLALRNDLVSAFNDSAASLNLNVKDVHLGGYAFDLSFGLKAYEIFSNMYSVSPRTASDDNFWRYISMSIIPDLVYSRWDFNPSRFWKESRRLWPKVLWWYIYLSWQGNIDKTYALLKDNTSDEIAQLVERSGTSGYRVDLYREIMTIYGSIDINLKKRTNNLFRKVMKLNTARTKVIEPSLVKGGEQAYVKELFSYFDT